MAFTVDDFEDLYRLLSERPEWRSRLRPLILGDEFIEVPDRLNRIDERLDRISESLVQHDVRLDHIDQRLERISETLDRMVAAQEQSELRLLSIDGTLGRFEGKFLELKYFQQFGSWFGRYVRGATQVIIDELDGLSNARQAGVISEREVERLYDLDFLVRGRSKATQTDELLAVEVSTTVRMGDVVRADERADTLRRAGYDARGFVGGVQIEELAKARADELGVVVDLHPSFAA